MRTAGVVVTGGRSSRMGTPKPHLEWHGSTLLYRAAALLVRSLDGPVVVVAAPGQELPPLPADVTVVRDPAEGLGPLQGIAAGLGAVAADSPAAFVCSTDLPFLHPAYLVAVLRLLDEHSDVALPFVRGHRQPLAAAYRTSLGAVAQDLIEGGARKPGELFARSRVRPVEEADLRADAALARLDPDLDSVWNINTPEDYAEARGRPGPDITVSGYGALATRIGRGTRTVAAATVGAAADAVGLPLDLHIAAALNGERISRDPQQPLVAGDAIAFISADPGG